MSSPMGTDAGANSGSLARLALSAPQTSERGGRDYESQVRDALYDPARFVEVVETFRMKPGLARSYDKEYLATLARATGIAQIVRYEENRSELVDALKRETRTPSRTKDLVSIILEFLIDYRGPEGRQFKCRDRQVVSLMILQERKPEDVPSVIKSLGGLRKSAKIYSNLIKPERGEEDAPAPVYPRALSELVGHVLPDTGDRALVMTHLARLSGKRVDIERTFKMPKLPGEDLPEFWADLEKFVTAWATKKMEA